MAALLGGLVISASWYATREGGARPETCCYPFVVLVILSRRNRGGGCVCVSGGGRRRICGRRAAGRRSWVFVWAGRLSQPRSGVIYVAQGVSLGLRIAYWKMSRGAAAFTWNAANVRRSLSPLRSLYFETI